MTDIGPITVIKSKRRTISIEINQNLEIIVRAPYRMNRFQIQRFVQEKEDWIRKHLEKIEERKKDPANEKRIFSAKELQQLAQEALQVIPERVAYYAPLVGVSYGRITIRHQKTRWGSCSGKGNLNFNCLLMCMPMEVIDYVVVHELCHRLEMNHSKRFWEQVERILPDYKIRKKLLKELGSSLV